jgi:hypothetical protein
VVASTSPPGSTIFALATSRMSPNVPAWLADTQTIWFSSARARSNRSKRRVQRSSASTGAGSVRAAGHADMHTTTRAPSTASARAASGNALS